MESFDFLLISASFFGYAAEIKAALEARGRSVLWFEDRPSLDTKTKAILRVAPSLIQGKSEAYFQRIIDEAEKHQIKDVLVIKGEALSPKMIGRMRDALPKARFTLYFWDSYMNMPADSPTKVGMFDRAFSFDPDDVAKDPRLKFRPLFFLDDYAALRAKADQDIDVLFIGTAHSDRYAVIKRIEAALPKDLSFKRVLFMRSALLYYFYRIFSKDYWFSRKREFIFEPLTKVEMMAFIARAKTVVDVERTVQKGFTMRTLEMLGASRKLITTNPSVRDAEFFLPSNQLIIDRENPQINTEFINSKWVPVPDEMLRRYSLSGWLNEIFETDQF